MKKFRGTGIIYSYYEKASCHCSFQYAGIDEDHKGLFRGIKACEADPGNAGTLSSLVNVVVDHFTSEEVCGISTDASSKRHSRTNTWLSPRNTMQSKQ